MSMHPFLPYYLAVGSSDSCVRLFDRRMLSSSPSRCKGGLISRFLVPEMEGKKRRITAVDYRPDGQEILVSFSSDYIYIFNPEDDDETRHVAFVQFAQVDRNCKQTAGIYFLNIEDI